LRTPHWAIGCQKEIASLRRKFERKYGVQLSELDVEQQTAKTKSNHAGRSVPQTLGDAIQSNPIFQQQKQLHEMVCAIAEKDGVDADELPNGSGPFGLVATNPIPCQGVWGSISYLGRLRSSDGQKVKYERIRSFENSLSPHPIDAYKICHADGAELATVYISMYQKRIPGKAPQGFSLAHYQFPEAS
jgi:hypothetical protein